MLFGVGHCKTMTLCGNHTPKALQTSAQGAQFLGTLGLTTPNPMNTEGVQQKWPCRQKCVATMNDWPAAAPSFVELFQSSSEHGYFPRVRCATLGFAVERHRRIHAAHTKQHRTTFPVHVIPGLGAGIFFFTKPRSAKSAIWRYSLPLIVLAFAHNTCAPRASSRDCIICIMTCL